MRAILGNAFIAIKEYQMKVAPLAKQFYSRSPNIVLVEERRCES